MTKEELVAEAWRRFERAVDAEQIQRERERLDLAFMCPPPSYYSGFRELLRRIRRRISLR